MFRRLAPLCLAGALVACGGASEPSAATQPAEVVEAPATTAPGGTAAPSPGTSDAPSAAVPDALNFSAPLVGGGTIELGASAGRPVLLWFWAPW